jgi:hypothetical protein
VDVDYNHVQLQEYKYVMLDLLYLGLNVDAHLVKQLHLLVTHVYLVHQIVLTVLVQPYVINVYLHINLLMENVNSLVQLDNLFLHHHQTPSQTPLQTQHQLIPLTPLQTLLTLLLLTPLQDYYNHVKFAHQLVQLVVAQTCV